MDKGRIIILGISCIIIAIVSAVFFFNYNYSSLIKDKDSKISNLENQIVNLTDEIDTFELENNNLRSQVNNLLDEKSTLETQVNTLNSEKQNLQNEINIVTSDLQIYQSTHAYSDSQYLEYVSSHLFSNEEYEVASFDFYYVKPEQQYGVYDLEDELSTLSWLHDYEEDVFDCSEMSAYMEWHLENAGWNSLIVAGDSPFSSGRHAWLLVETSEGAYMSVESTTIEIVWWSDPNFDNYFVYDYDFDTILDALDYLDTEFDWWQ